MLIDTIIRAPLYSRSTGYLADGACAVAEGIIVAVGAAAHIVPLASATTRMVRYADDQLLLPGFVDSHQHFLSYVRSRESRLSLWQVVSFAQLRDTLQLAADRGDGTHWVIGVGYDQGRLHEQRHPTLAELDTMLPDIPAVIIRACSHIALVNSAALARAGVTATTADPVGGRIGRDADGALTGILEESAMQLVMRHATPAPVDWQGGIVRAAREYHARGITAIGEAAIGHIQGVTDLTLMQTAQAEGRLPLRVHYMGYGAVAEAWLQGEALVPTTAWQRAAYIKYFIDGTLGGGSAWVSQGYRDEVHNTGFPLYEDTALYDAIASAHQRGYDVAIHAIGDRAVDQALRMYAQVLTAYPRATHRHRLEHVESTRPELWPLFGAYGIIAGVQPVFMWFEESDISRLPDPLLPYAHPWASIVRHGGRIALGSDNPVVPDFAPVLGIAAATTRQNYHGQTFGVHEALAWQVAVDAYTADAAYALHAEQEYGDLRIGLNADFVVLDGGHPALPWHTRAVQATWVAGVCVYQP